MADSLWNIMWDTWNTKLNMCMYVLMQYFDMVIFQKLNKSSVMC
jgi:hypothetical protein